VRDEQRGLLRERFGDLVAFDVGLSRYTTYRIGGPAAALIEPRDPSHVADALRLAAELGLAWLVLGLGSNVLLPDEGFHGIVLRMGKGMAGVRQEGPDDTLWTVGAGLPIPLLARRTAARGLGGVNRLIGIPGTVGGGVFMNAGAHGQEFKDVVRWVDVVATDGTTSRIGGDRLHWRYRSSGLDSVVVRTQLSLVPTDPDVLRRELQSHLRWRKAGTPFDEPCCGSVFRNPEADALRSDAGGLPEPPTAGRLIDACNLKGFRIGGAEVSPKHANYIVNTGGASAADVRSVIEHVRRAVLDRFGVELHLEVQIIDPISERVHG
jgi:UDP-N-acetylmuramate dehydrogenase